MATYKHLRSTTANKRPTTSIADGQLAINTNTASPGLFFKDSAGTGIVKVGPVHVGTTAPNSSPAGSSGNYTGEQWLDTSVSPAQMKVWNGSAWVGIVADELPVSKLQDGAARQLIQTDAAGTGVEWTSNVDVPGTLDVTSTATFDSIAQHPLGTAGAPTITFTGDTNTGIYSPGADQVALATGGTGRLFVDASGNVGVGDNSPFLASGYSTLRVNGSTGGLIEVTSNATRVLQIQSDGAASGAQILTIANGSNPPLIFGTNSTERMRITSDGKLGLGTSSPGGKLTVIGTGSNVIQVSDNSTYTFELGRSKDNAGSFGYIGGTGNSGLTFGANNTEYMRLDTSGRLGIGTTNPLGKCVISNSGAEGIEFIPGGTPNNNVVYHYNRSTSSWISVESNASAHIFRDGSTERARIDSSGRLLVGTSSSTNVGSTVGAIQQIRYTTGVGLSITRDGSASNLVLARTGAAPASIVSNGDLIGDIRWAGADGTDIETQAASIGCHVDGTPGTNDMPGRLVFSVTSDGSASPTEALRITNDRYVRLASGSGGIQFNGDTAAANALDDYEEGTFTPTLLTDGGAPITLDVTATGYYRKVGSIVHMWGTVATTTNLSSANYYQLGTGFTSSLAVATHVGTAASATNAGNANQQSVFSVTSRTTGGLYFVRIAPDYDFSNADGFSFHISTPV